MVLAWLSSHSGVLITSAFSAIAAHIATKGRRTRKGWPKVGRDRPEADLKITDCGCTITVRHKADPYSPDPRSSYLSWDDYFMALAFLSAQRSKDPNKQVGACIVGADNIILGIGYNGFPRGCPDGKLPWAKLSRNGSTLDTKYPYVVHAEANCILNAKGSPTLSDSTIYVTMFPCNECAKLIIQAGITTVVFYEDKHQVACPTLPRPDEAYQASRKLLCMAGVNLRQHRLKLPLTLHAPREKPPKVKEVSSNQNTQGSNAVICFPHV